MKLENSKGPQAAEEVIRHYLDRIHKEKIGPEALQKLSASQLKIHSHHQVFDLSGSDVESGTPLSQARLHVSRYLISHGSKLLAAAEVRESSCGCKAVFNRINDGPHVAGHEKALKLAESLSLEGSFRLQVLRVPSLYVMALWLKSTDGGNDVFIPVSSTRGFTARSYTERKFLSTLRQLKQGR